MSEAKKYYWLKLKEGFFSDKEIKKLRKIAGGDTYTIIYLKLMLLSLRDNGKLFFDGVEDTFYEELALEIDEDADNVRFTLLFLQKTGLMEEISDTEAFLTRMPECIGSETSKAELMRKKREREKLSGGGNSVTPALPQVTKCYTEIEKKKRDREREQIEETAGKPPVPPAPPATSDPVPYAEIQSLYNEICKSFRKCMKLSDKRKAKIRTRFKNGYTLEQFKTAFEKMEASRFMKGENNTGWKADLDWLIENDENLLKVLEGKYDNKGGNNNGRTGQHGGIDAENAQYGSWI